MPSKIADKVRATHKQVNALAVAVGPTEAVEVAVAAGGMRVKKRPLHHGFIPGRAIMDSAHRTAIDKMIFVDRYALTQVSQMVKEKFGMYLSTKLIARYRDYQFSKGLDDIRVIPGTVEIDKIEDSIREDMALLDAVRSAGFRLVQNNRISMRDSLHAIEIRLKMMGEHNAIRLLTAETIYSEALQSAMRIIFEECDEPTRDRMQKRLLDDPAFTKAMNATFDQITGGTGITDIELTEDGDRDTASED